MTPSTASTSPGPAEPRAGESPLHAFAQRHTALLVYLPFLLLSLLIYLFLHHDYERGRTQNAIRQYESEEKWALAIPYLEKMIDLVPKSEVQWRQQMGWDYIRLGDYLKATEQFETAKKLNPALDLAKPRMICYFEDGRTEEAETYLKKVLASNAKDPAANFFLAKDLMRDGKLIEAGQSLRLTALDPDWNKRAEPLRKELAQKMFGDAAATEKSEAPATPNSPAPAPATATPAASK